MSALRGPSRARLAAQPPDACVLCTGDMKSKASAGAKLGVDAMDLLYLNGFADGVRLARAQMLPSLCPAHEAVLVGMLQARGIRLRFGKRKGETEQ